MTALTVPDRPAEDRSRPPVPWRRMACFIKRQHRIALAGVALFLGALAVCLWRVGLGLHNAFAAAAACRPATSPVCDELQTKLAGLDIFLANGYVLQAVPALIGAFARGARAGFESWRRAPSGPRLDPGFRPLALDARQAGAARGCARDGCRIPQRAALVVLRAVPRDGQPVPSGGVPRSPTCSSCAGLPSVPGR